MALPDMPSVPPQNVPVIIAQAEQSQPNDLTRIRTLGVCLAATNNPDYLGDNRTSPVEEASFYLQQYEHRTVTGATTVAILQQPKHGTMRLVTEGDRGKLFDSSASLLDASNPAYIYVPEPRYEGKDSATVLVHIGGVQIKVKYFYQAISGILGNEGSDKYCIPKGTFWKISSFPDTGEKFASITSRNENEKNPFFGMKR